MDRKEKILKFLNTRGPGIELGPSHNPVASRKEGYNVQIIDHLTREELLEKYKNDPVNLGNIEEVDFVWRGETYRELTEKEKFYDWIIASHVIEHMPDLIGFLNDCDAILKDDGVLSLAVPDKRYCFDHYRPITGISRIIDSHFQQNKIHTAGAVAEYFLNVVSRSGHLSWDSGTTGEYAFVHSAENALRGMRLVNDEKRYLDIHSWCFVPHSFRLIIHDLFCLGFIKFREANFYPTEGSEFYVALSRTGKGIDMSRLEMLDMIEAETSSRQKAGMPGRNFIRRFSRWLYRN